ncbi:MAG: PIG-L family deacetylase [Firmicutes bacterium]|nr:PIG-L family deacetylase [Bacillota bacterium]
MANKLMIVAHPDDEVIFGGAHLLQQEDWKVICVTNGNRERRANEFLTVMDTVGAECEIWSFRDTYSTHFDREGLKESLAQELAKATYKRVVTHGFKGEYGHPQHRAIARIVDALVQDHLYMFSRGDKKLAPEVIEQKWELISLYRSQRHTIRDLRHDDDLDAYIEREAFVRIK